MRGIDPTRPQTATPTGENVRDIVYSFENATQHCRSERQKNRRAPNIPTEIYEGKLHAVQLQSEGESSRAVPAIPARPALGKGRAQAAPAWEKHDATEVCKDRPSRTSNRRREPELESQLASAQEDVARISAQHKKCEGEIERLQGELDALQFAKLEVAQKAQEEIELKKDLEASQTRERDLIREIRELNETVIKASEELRQDCEYQISQRRELRNSACCEQLPAQTEAVSCPRTPVEGVDGQSKYDSDSTPHGSVFDSATATSNSLRGTSVSTRMCLTADGDNEQNQKGVRGSTARKDRSHYSNSTRTSRSKSHAGGSKISLAFVRKKGGKGLDLLSMTLH
ncbi:hypothetical protein MGU_10529 [Metarhizium guizhouense ARSEF 977]|uniref:Uncharacterized protein n=1 Tax=Metarhizium guizhouense (strain ARSEF 977) TaxID=1276136 RepID=A0A0B4HRP2_METGA|nr:hypothetical protein MGU_10529 [Metarhizium guizhouense ARSEF 977]